MDGDSDDLGYFSPSAAAPEPPMPHSVSRVIDWDSVNYQSRWARSTITFGPVGKTVLTIPPWYFVARLLHDAYQSSYAGIFLFQAIMVGALAVVWTRYVWHRARPDAPVNRDLPSVPVRVTTAARHVHPMLPARHQQWTE